MFRKIGTPIDTTRRIAQFARSLKIYCQYSLTSGPFSRIRSMSELAFSDFSDNKSVRRPIAESRYIAAWLCLPRLA
jgi:hypothetical protein